MKKSEIFLFCALSFIVGIFFGLAKELDFFYFYVFLVSSLVLLAVIWRKIYLRILFFGILFLFLGLARSNFSLWLGKRNPQFFTKKRVENLISTNETGFFLGVISGEPEQDYEKQRIKIKTELFGNVLAYTSIYPRYFYGDKVEFKCKLNKPEPFGNFRYDKNLEMESIYAVCYYPQINVIGKNNGNKIYQNILTFKGRLQNIITKNMAEPQASILSAFLLGNKYGINKDIRNLFSQAGISHIIAISGMHIAILGVIILFLLNFIGISRKKSFYISSVLIIFYIIMIGAPASAVRASVMAIILLLALQCGRLAKMLNLITLAACIMIFYRPGILFYDMGFQFSFAAVLGIYFLFSPIKRLVRIPINESIKDLMAITISAQIFTFPLVLYYFGMVSIVSIFANILIVWLVPVIMSLGLLFLAAGSLSFMYGVKILISSIIEILIAYIIGISKMLTSAQWTVLNLENFPFWALFVFYTAIAYSILFIRKKA